MHALVRLSACLTPRVLHLLHGLSLRVLKIGSRLSFIVTIIYLSA